MFGAPVPITPGYDAEFAEYNAGQAVTGVEAVAAVIGGASVTQIGKLRNLLVRVHVDRKPLRFPDSWGPLAGNRAYLQLTIYLKGVKNSNTDLRIPIGCRKPWGDHQP